ncbi:hypothetical protein [Marinomonas sp. PE14-40]|uniref:hypothetical protein n=1 Tax=Marinomonas sp. PE14-40 TaxID=3060621 RepID=UPI003F6816CC
MNKPHKLGFLEVETPGEGFQANSLSQFINANKVFCFSLFLFLCFLISTLVSIAISLLVTPAPAPSTTAVMLLSNNLNEIKSEQTQLIQNYQEFKQEQLAIKQSLEANNVTAIKLILMDQEKNFQLFLQSLKQGMQSLSGDLPNGDEWYQDYSEQISLAEKHSFRRHTLLSMIQTNTYQQD